MLKAIEIYVTDIIKGRKKGVCALVIKGILRLLSYLYRLIVAVRNLAYDSGWLYQYNPPVPVVISVGNIILGGSGKTPFVLLLAKRFYDETKLAVISRGWRSPAEKLRKPLILSNGEGPLHSASYCGDEPYLLARNLPKALFFVGRDKREASNMAARQGADLIILDDAMQHRKLARDYEIIILDGTDPFGDYLFFPGGFLRDSPKRLQKADLIVLNNIENKEHFLTVKEEVAKLAQAPVIGMRAEVKKICALEGGRPVSVRDKRVAIFCGVAHPGRVLRTVRDLGAIIVDRRIFSNHYPFHEEEINQMADTFKANGAELMLCTEKDAVKLAPMSRLSIPLFWIQVELAVMYGQNEWSEFVGSVRDKLPATMGEEI